LEVLELHPVVLERQEDQVDHLVVLVVRQVVLEHQEDQVDLVVLVALLLVEVEPYLVVLEVRLEVVGVRLVV
jgi:hypothetical protein